MILGCQLGGVRYRLDPARARSIAIPLAFDGPQPSHFGAPAASARPLVSGGFVGDTRQGGSCNVSVLSLVPHCNGTHTESVGHIVDDPVPVHEALGPALFAVRLVSLAPTPAARSADGYRPAAAPDDLLLTRAALEAAFAAVPLPGGGRASDGELEGLVVRTLPNDTDKTTRRWGERGMPPYFSIEAIDYLVGRGVRHLLVDFPSVDRMYDEGRLTVHHRFWGVPEGSHRLAPGARSLQTITEMVFVPDTLPDGVYVAALQIPAFLCDAAPARPFLYPLEPALAPALESGSRPDDE